MQFICTDEEWRAKRLQKALSIACKMIGITELQAENLIDKIQDDRGLLAVFWKHRWTKRQEEAFSIAWGLCGEEEKAVAHIPPRHLMTGGEA